MLTLENELSLLEKYELTPTELFTVKLILLAQEEGNFEGLLRLSKIIKLRDVLMSLQNKKIILKSVKIGEEGTKLEVEDLIINSLFKKQYFRASFEMGEELFEAFPQTCFINGQYFNLRRVSKKYDSLEDAFKAYGKAINYNNDTHNKILELINWGIQNDYTFTTLDSFIVDRDWNNIENVRNKGIININNEAVKML